MQVVPRLVCRCTRRLAVVAAALVSLSASAWAAGSSAIEISLSGDPHAGYVTVAWSAPELSSDSAGIPEFQLERARDASFDSPRLIYHGTHTSSVRSGLRDGAYFYRVRARLDGDWSAWSETAEFDVEHHSARLAGLLFGLGGVVFLATLIFLVRMKT